MSIFSDTHITAKHVHQLRAIDIIRNTDYIYVPQLDEIDFAV